MGLTYGTILGIIVVTNGIIRYKSGMILRGDQMLNYVYWGIFTIMVFFAVFRFNKVDALAFEFRNTIKIGLCMGLVSGIMYTIYIVILNNYIDTELSEKVVQLNEKALIVDNPKLTEEEVTNSWNSMKIRTLFRGLIYTLVCMFFGVIHSVVSTIFIKRIKRT